VRLCASPFRDEAALLALVMSVIVHLSLYNYPMQYHMYAMHLGLIMTSQVLGSITTLTRAQMHWDVHSISLLKQVAVYP
jgi:hypothetical protein